MQFASKLRPGFIPETYTFAWGSELTYRQPSTMGACLYQMQPTNANWSGVRVAAYEFGSQHIAEDHFALHALRSRSAPLPVYTDWFAL